MTRPYERCQCLAGACGAIDGCVSPAEKTAVGDEASVELCRLCFDGHRDAALAVLEEDR